MASESSNTVFARQRELNAHIMIRDAVRKARLQLNPEINVNDDLSPKSKEELVHDAHYVLLTTMNRLNGLAVEVTERGQKVTVLD